MSSALHTRICDLFGIRYPIVQTGMGYVSDAGLVSATPNAGGMGFLAGATLSFDQLATALDDVFTPRTPAQDEEYAWKRRLFFDHLDDGNARRVVTRVRELALSEPGGPRSRA